MTTMTKVSCSDLPNVTISNDVLLEDLDSLLRLEECIDGGWNRNMMQEALNSNEYHFLKAIEDGEIIGYINYKIVLDEMEINAIAVLKTHRGRGIAKRLILEALRLSKDKGAVVAFLEVNENNTAAIRLYECCEFSKISMRKNYYGNQSALIYKREI